MQQWVDRIILSISSLLFRWALDFHRIMYLFAKRNDAKMQKKNSRRCCQVVTQNTLKQSDIGLQLFVMLCSWLLPSTSTKCVINECHTAGVAHMTTRRHASMRSLSSSHLSPIPPSSLRKRWWWWHVQLSVSKSRVSLDRHFGCPSIQHRSSMCTNVSYS